MKNVLKGLLFPALLSIASSAIAAPVCDLSKVDQLLEDIEEGYAAGTIREESYQFFIKNNATTRLSAIDTCLLKNKNITAAQKEFALKQVVVEYKDTVAKLENEIKRMQALLNDPNASEFSLEGAKAVIAKNKKDIAEAKTYMESRLKYFRSIRPV